jgi:hypothetical protein
MRSGMPPYRNHFRRSRDAPEVNRDYPHCTSKSREVNRLAKLDAVAVRFDWEERFLHPPGGGIIQTFCSPVSLM